MEESIRVLKLRRNALSPISSLPPEIFEAIFSFLCLPAPAQSADHQARLFVSHVCHQWREIALNQSLLWSNVNFTTLSLDGVTEILARAKTAPLYLEARVPGCLWNDIRFSAFQNELRAHLPDLCHLLICTEIFYLHETLGRLVSPAPTLESLSLFSIGGIQNPETGDHLFIPDTLFSGSAPRLSRLKLYNCEISWKSPLLKGLTHLDIHSPNPRPKLAAWLGALEVMSQLKTLVLHSATPIASQDDVDHNVTLPSLTHLEISAFPAGCALTLSHLDLPALTTLSITVSDHDIQVLLPHLARHAYGPQDTGPLQSMLVRSEVDGAKILAWTLPDIDVEVQDLPISLATTMFPPRVALFFTNDSFLGVDVNIRREFLDAALPALPLSSLVTLLAQDFTAPTEKRFWLLHAPKWPLLRRAQLEVPAHDEFIMMLLERNNWEPPLLPSLTELVLFGSLSHDLASALRKCVEEGVPLERLDLRMCVMPSPEEVRLLSEIVVDVLGPDSTAETKERMISRWKIVVYATFKEEYILSR